MEIQNPEQYRAALYIRLSKEDERDGPSQSVQNQESMLRDFVTQHHLTIQDCYIDDGYSGTHFDRPGFRRMIQDIEAQKVNLVLTKDLSRLGRDYILTGHYMERYFPEHRVRYISLLDGIDTGSDSPANDITPFRAILNDLYAKDISKKIRSVKRDQQRKGAFIGGKPMYGYKMHPTEKNKIVIDEGAAPVVRRMFSLALEGMSCRSIAAQLNAEQVPTPAVYAGLTVSKPGPYPGKWSSARISELLQNETYIGNMVQGRRVKISYKSQKCVKQDRDHWIVVPHTHEPLVDAETFHTVGKLIQSRRHTRSRKYDFLLKGLIYCHECGYPLSVLNRKNARGEDVLYFVCRTYQRFTKAGVCTSHTIQEKTVTEAVCQTIEELIKTQFTPAELYPIAVSLLEEADRAAPKADSVQEIHQEIRILTNQLDAMYWDKLNGLLSPEDFIRLSQPIQAERATLEAQRRMIQESEERPVSIQDRANQYIQKFIQGAAASREVLTSLIQRVELTETKTLAVTLYCVQQTLS